MTDKPDKFKWFGNVRMRVVQHDHVPWSGDGTLHSLMMAMREIHNNALFPGPTWRDFLETFYPEVLRDS